MNLATVTVKFFLAGEHLDFERAVKEEIKKMERVKTVYSVFGRYDLIAQVEAPTL